MHSCGCITFFMQSNDLFNRISKNYAFCRVACAYVDAKHILKHRGHLLI